jgi:hypothetical protein
MTWKDRFPKLAERAVSVMSDLAEVVVHVRSQPTPLTIAAVASRAVKAIRDATQQDPEVFYHDWHHIDLSPVSGFVLGLCEQSKLTKQEPSAQGKGRIVVADLHGIDIGWIVYDTWRSGPWIRRVEFVQSARAAVRTLIWGRIGSALRVHVPPFGDLMLREDRLIDSMPSMAADEIYQRCQRFIGAGHRRSVLLHGQPGTGKSHIIRQVATRSGQMTLRLHARDIERASGLPALIDLLEPGAVLIDDIDRLREPGSILEEIDEMRTGASLLLVTANDLSKLDPALLRPGRFDDVVHVATLDDGVLDRLLVDVPLAEAARLRRLPVAYVHEFLRHQDAFGHEAAIAAMAELEKRAGAAEVQP